jgi:hypothetical protein
MLADRGRRSCLGRSPTARRSRGRAQPLSRAKGEPPGGLAARPARIVKPVRLAATGARRCGEILNLLVEDAALSLIADLRTDIESA